MVPRVLARALVSIGLLTTISLGQWQLETVVSGQNVVPPTASTAGGVGVFTLNEPSHTITYYFVLIGAFAGSAEIRLGSAGSNGPTLFTLAGGPVVFDGTTGALTPAQALAAHEEGLHVIAFTPAFPAGEVRGQLQPVKKTYYEATLTGAQVVPPTASTATGRATIRLNEPDGVLVFDVRTTGVAPASAARLRIGAPGSNGPVAVELTGADGHFCGVSEALSPAEVVQLLATNTYISVESPAFPAGEIRGAVTPAHASFSIPLSGTHVVPPAATSATGCGWGEFDPVTSQLVYHVETSAFAGSPPAVTVNRGPDGGNGALVATLAGGPTSWNGTLALTPSQVNDLYRARLYVSVATTAFPQGELRGQLRPDPYLFGVGGVGFNSVMKVSANGYAPSHRATVTLATANTYPFTTAYLLLGTSSSFSVGLGQPLPYPLPPAGNLWVDPDPGFFLPVPADSSGCAEITFPVPTDPIFACARAWVQFASLDPLAPTGVVLTDALEFTVLP